MVEFADTAVKTLDTPSKWDIIPIHSSDRASFKFCRRAWKWSSPNQFNLIPMASVYGVDKNLWFGTGIHHALEQYYNPIIKEDPVVAWEAWFDLQWKGGIVHESEVKAFVDRNPTRFQQGTVAGHDGILGMPHEIVYRVDGLKDILPD